MYVIEHITHISCYIMYSIVNVLWQPYNTICLLFQLQATLWLIADQHNSQGGKIYTKDYNNLYCLYTLNDKNDQTGKLCQYSNDVL